MADSADRRSEGKRIPERTENRRNYKKRKSTGKCVVGYCTNETKNRSYCYDCSTKQAKATYFSGFRGVFREVAESEGLSEQDAQSALDALIDRIDRRGMSQSMKSTLNMLATFSAISKKGRGKQSMAKIHLLPTRKAA